jgi:hypothetical protein
MTRGAIAVPPVFGCAPAGKKQAAGAVGWLDPGSLPRYAPGPCRAAATSEDGQVLTAPDPRETSPA